MRFVEKRKHGGSGGSDPEEKLLTEIRDALVRQNDKNLKTA